MEVYLVGGAVRDIVMGVTPKDYDYVVVGSSPEYMLKLGFEQVGKDFPVFLHPITKEEYALARTERSTGSGNKEFTCDWEGVTLQEDLLRRDLTINSMAIPVVYKSNGETSLVGEKYNHTKIHGHSEESKIKMSVSQVGKIQTDETKAKISKTMTGKMVGNKNPQFGKTTSDRQKKSVGEIWKGETLSEEHKKKMSESANKIKAVTCPHCGKVGKPAPMKRWHFDNCKER